ncbi:hypothetical protein [Bacillus velezensis]|uniref:hypothetical protein n=1 Tax=Bacillus velezensis TaxID=492670 RepID=UPI0009F165A8|nr:hypothetical protein [Bacillus velezensis]MDL5023941.1 hypothetical protein [Bacillus velezensis]MEC3610056.1 hypothetical protein [Bacillus velezensis]MEC3679114.1 hypothetical protein [Bacillus velezensis]OQV53623.1 hypothetical protein B5Z20_04740 [Bacillus velezensis]OQV55646.1 hypothetical protein B5Z22_09605 [Bacillus velezensis]
MNWLEFISSILKNLAWPVVILIAALKLKEPLSKMISTLAKIKYKDWEFEFLLDKKLDQITVLATQSDEDSDVEELYSKQKGENLIDQTPLTGYKPPIGLDTSIALIRESKVLDARIHDIYEKVKKGEGIGNESTELKIKYLVSEKVLSQQLAKSIRLAKQAPFDFTYMKVMPDFLINKYRNNLKYLSEQLRSIYYDLESSN